MVVVYVRLGPTRNTRFRASLKLIVGASRNCWSLTRKKSEPESPPSLVSFPKPKKREDSIPDAYAKRPIDRREFSNRKTPL